jgi:hypothetical protein
MSTNLHERVFEKRIKIIEEMLASIEKKINVAGQSEKASLGDYIRLLQLRAEMEGIEPKEISVQWIEPPVSDKSIDT